MTDTTLESLVERTVQRLTSEFKRILSVETVRFYAADSADAFSSALSSPGLADCVPFYIFKFTRERLIATAQFEGKILKERPEVLFVCVHNAGRSQMAAALTHSLSEGRVHIRTAGSTPARTVNRVVIKALEEIGLEFAGDFPKPLTDEVVRAADVVVTMGCGDACPVYPGKKYEDWEIADPAGKRIEEVRLIRDGIRQRVEGLLRSLS